MTSIGSSRRAASVCAAFVVALLAASPSLSVPQSLRSEEDVVDVADTFMRNMSASNVKGAYRVAAPFWPLGASLLAERVAEAEKQRRALRKTFGLSLGYEMLTSERAGERVIRISQLERFDKGALIWRFVFYRADTSWQLVDLSQTADLTTLFSAR